MSRRKRTVRCARCVFCGSAGSVEVDAGRWEAYLAAQVTESPLRFIQNALPELTAGQREQLITGTHDACFEAAFGGEEED